MRIALRVEYEGTAYSGWQRQLNAPSVQETLENAIRALAGTATTITGASRTDAGVHALHQVAHFDTDSGIPPEKWAYAINTRLPPDIRARASCRVPEAFHARFGAIGKVYTYDICNRRHMAAIGRQTRAHVPLPLDVTRMARAAQAVVGRHDFRAFAASGSIVKDTVRTIRAVEITRAGDDVRMAVMGDGFLYNMVRILAGTLIDIAHEKCPENALQRMIETGDRLKGGITAPARGLTLARVFYPLPPPPHGEEIFLPVCRDLREFALDRAAGDWIQ